MNQENSSKEEEIQPTGDSASSKSLALEESRNRQDIVVHQNNEYFYVDSDVSAWTGCHLGLYFFSERNHELQQLYLPTTHLVVTFHIDTVG